MLKDMAWDAAGIKLAAQGATGASAAGVTWIAAAGEWSTALFGIPLPVLLCAALGAFGALSVMETRSIRQAIASSLTAMIVAAVGTPLALHAATGDGKPLPITLAPGVAIIAALALQLILPWLFANGGRMLSELWTRALDKAFGPRSGGQGGQGGGDAR